MASIVNGLIEKVQIDNNAEQSIASTAYGICTTPANTVAKTVEMSGFVLLAGVTVHIKFTYSNTAEAPTLNINNTLDIPIVLYGNTSVGQTEAESWTAGAMLTLTYDGTSWVMSATGSSGAMASLSIPNSLVVTDANATVTTGAAFNNTHGDLFLRKDGTWAAPAFNLPIANYNLLGGVKPAYSNSNSVSLNTNPLTYAGNVTVAARSTETARYYAIEMDKDGIMYVNIPWTDHYAWTEITGKPNLAGSSVEGGPATQVNVTAFTASNGTTQYLLYGNSTSGGVNVLAQASLFVENTVSSDIITSTILNIGAAKVLGGIALHSAANNNCYGTISPTLLTESRNYTLPDESGTLALTTDEMTPASHKHGNIENNGTLQLNDITIANGDKLIVTDASDNNKIARAELTFDGSTTDKALSQKGTWESFNDYVHPTGDGNSHVPATSTDKEGLYLRAGALENSAAWAAPTVWYGTCTSLANAEIKDVECPSFPKGNHLEVGTIIFVTFNNTNNASVNNIKLRVNSRSDGDAKPIRYLYNNDSPQVIPDKNYLQGSQTYMFSYDGSNWVVKLHFNSNDRDPGIRVYVDNVTSQNFNDDYPLLVSRTAEASLSAPYIDDVFAIISSTSAKVPTYNPYTGELKVPTVIADITGDLTGTADVALKLTTSNLGSLSKPIYLVAGEATECDDYAGGTSLTLNHVSKYADTAEIYAPTVSGDQYQILVSGGSNTEPVWSAIATLVDNSSTIANTPAYNILTLGNGNNVTTASAHSEGKLVLYSAGIQSHTLDGASTGTPYVHTLPNVDGWIAVGGSTSGPAEGVADDTTLMYLSASGELLASTADVGGVTQPVWLNDGTLTALTFTANRLYYSESTTSFAETGHYATDTELAINADTITNTYTFEVNGTTSLLDALDIGGNIAPTTTNTYSLGINGNTPMRWASVFIGTDDTYGSNTQPIYWAAGVPTPLTYTANRLYYSASTTSFEATGHYASTTAVTIGGTSAPINSGIFQVIGKSTMQDIVPEADLSYSLGTNTTLWSTLYTETVSTRYIDAEPTAKHSDGILYIGYGSTCLTKQISLCYSGNSETHREALIINSNNVYVPNNLGIGGQNVSYNFYVNGTSLFAGSLTLSSDLIFSATGTTGTSNKIKWSGSGDSADIYYYVPTAGQGNLVLNTSNTNCLIGLSQADVINMFFNTNTPSFYPAANQVGDLGIAANGTAANARRWAHVYIGGADTYGDPYLPVYWNKGVPTYLSGVVQYKAFTIASGATSTTLTSTAYNQLNSIHTYVIQIVVTSGQSYLNGAISWSSAQKSGSTTEGQITLTTAATSGDVSGYIITARGCAAP